jgi:short-subunit dehydrogenase
LKNAIVTGYSSGIGKAICQELEINNFNIIKLSSRLENLTSLEKEVKNILITKDIDLLVNCAGVGIFCPYEEISINKIQEVISINLTAPLVLTNLVLRSLKKTQGKIINISSIEATKHSKFSALYSTTKSALRDFSLCLFEEIRKNKITVTTINPDITKTSFFDNLQFEPTTKEDTYLLPQTIAKTVIDIINTKGAITDLTIRPYKFQINKKGQK